MRGFQCHLFAKTVEDGKYKKDYGTACFSGVNSAYAKDKTFEQNVVYISEFDDPETRKYTKLLLFLINKITPCSIVVDEGGKNKYIRFELLPTYDQSLVLLNFIRNLWHNPKLWGQPELGKEYYKIFFKTLAHERLEDPLERLTNANKVACTESKLISTGHSNCHPGDELKIKTTKALLEYKGCSTRVFLTDLEKCGLINK